MNAQRNRPSSKKNRLRRFSQLRLVFGLLLLLGMAGVLHVRSTAQAQEPNDALLGQLREASGGEVVVSYHDETGVVRFIGTSNETPIRQSRALAPDATPDQAARAFLGTYGSLFGIREQQAELSVMAEQKVDDGRSFVRYQQRHQGIPVLAGELIVQVNRMGSVVSANGETLPNVTLDVNPRISAADAERTALELVAKHEGVSVETLRAKQAELWIFNPALIEGPGMRVNSLVWRTEVTPTDLLPIRYLVLVDAKTGAVTLQFNQIAEAKNRRVYDAANTSTLPGTLRRTEGQAATGDADIDLAYDYAGHTYDFFMTEHNRDSLDGAGMALISTVRYCDPDQPCPLENAFWNGQQMAYGQGYASADDVVGHELTHGVTNFSSNLLYYYQSGAINESFSDVWGEFVDLTNARGNDTAGVRWLIGEDLAIGAIRDMKNPPAFEHADRIGSSLFYCGSQDSGGVHWNSGVNNKAAFLMTDGGTFNGRTVTGLGISKVADLYYEVQNRMMTSGSNYRDLNDYLTQAAINLGFTATERTQVQNALLAVEMNQGVCGMPTAPAVCPAGQVPTNAFYEDFEAGTTRWTTGALTGTSQWVRDNTYATSGDYSVFTPDQATTSDTFFAMNQNVTVPANAFLYFRHHYEFEYGFSNYDGGIVEYSTNGGTSWQDAGTMLTEGGYDGTLASGNPLGSRQAFIGESFGFTATRGSLNSLAGQNVRFRFRLGTDVSTGEAGWQIDDVRVYTCGMAPTQQPAVTLNPTSLAFGNQQVNTTSNARTSTLTNSGNATLNITSIVASGDFLQTNNCGTSRPAAGSCTISVTFRPTATGSRTGAITINSNAPGSPHTITLSGTGTTPPTITTRPQTDFNGDGKADILWRNASTGQNNIYQMNGKTVVSNTAITRLTDLNYKVAGVGDFTGDGKADILWRHHGTGYNYLWTMNGAAVVSSQTINRVSDLNWKVAGVADFNADGKADILWRHATTGQNSIYLMNGKTVLSNTAITRLTDLNYTVAGLADFTGDGKTDILWRHIGTGYNYLWTMNGTAVAASATINRVSDLNMKVAGVGDFNADGKADILWRNASTGQNSIYLMNGKTVVSNTAITRLTDLNYKVAGVGDFTGDGKADILWRHHGTGYNYLWTMNGTTVAASATINRVSDLNMKVVGFGISPDYYNWNRLAASEEAEAALMAASVGDAEMQLVEPESLEGAPYEASDEPMVLDVPADAVPEVALPGTLPEDAYTDEPVIDLDEQEPTSVTLARFESQPTSGTWAVLAPFALLGLLGAGLLLRRRTR